MFHKSVTYFVGLPTYAKKMAVAGDEDALRRAGFDGALAVAGCEEAKAAGCRFVEQIKRFGVTIAQAWGEAARRATSQLVEFRYVAAAIAEKDKRRRRRFRRVAGRIRRRREQAP